jgi:hypothetical protein
MCDNFGTLCQARTDTMCFSRCNEKNCYLSLLSPFQFFADNQNMAQSYPPPSFDCCNMNCYRKFPTERGLCGHSNFCKKYMSSERPYASCREVVADVYSTKMNPPPNSAKYGNAQYINNIMSRQLGAGYVSQSGVTSADAHGSGN